MENTDFIKNLIIEDENGLYVSYQDFQNLKLSLEEKNKLLSYFTKQGIKIIRSKALDEDFIYCLVPKIADIRYDKNGNIIYENYSELDKYLEEKFLPINVNEFMEIDEVGNRGICSKYIHLNKLLRRRFCYAEFRYVMDYLKERDIVVRGDDAFLAEEFDNYQHCSSQKSYKKFDDVDPTSFLEDILEYRKNSTIEVRNKFIEKNMKIVSWIAFRYSFLTGIEIDELNSYGVEGLIEALEKFDPSVSSNFYSCATDYIKRSILKGIAEVQGYYSNMEFYNGYIRIKREVENEEDDCIENNILLLDEIIERMATKGIISKQTIAENKRRVLLRMCLPIDDYIDSIELSDNNSLYYEFLSNECHELLKSSFEKLASRRVSVVKRHYGIGCEPMTFDEIAREEGTTHQSISEIEKRVFDRIRTKKLKDMYDELKNFDYNPNSIIEHSGKVKKYERS